MPPLEGLKPGAPVADRAHDADDFLKYPADSRVKAATQPKSNRNVRRDRDRKRYKKRHAIERLFGGVKEQRWNRHEL